MNKTINNSNARSGQKEIKRQSRIHKMDTELLVVVTIMLLYGLVMVASASSATAFYRQQGNSMFFFNKQLMVAVGGFALMMLLSMIDYHVLANPAIILPGMLISWALTWVAAFSGPLINGARRWIIVGPLTLQPSELLKIGSVILIALICTNQSVQAKNKFTSGTLFFFAIIGVICLPLLKQPHKSALMLIALVCITIVIVSGAKLRHYIALLPFGVAGACFLIFKDGYSLARLESYLDPFKDPRGSGWQAVQSLYAIGSGGLFGMGLGRSVQKFLYIPEPQNDFIFAIICEELGFIGALFVLVLFAIVFIRCIKISLEAPDALGSLIAVGMTSLIMYQAVINIAVVTGLVPVTGMPLPFFSAGGTSLMFTLAAMGVLLNISRQSKVQVPATHLSPDTRKAQMKGVRT